MVVAVCGVREGCTMFCSRTIFARMANLSLSTRAGHLCPSLMICRSTVMLHCDLPSVGVSMWCYLTKTARKSSSIVVLWLFIGVVQLGARHSNPSPVVMLLKDLYNSFLNLDIWLICKVTNMGCNQISFETNSYSSPNIHYPIFVTHLLPIYIYILHFYMHNNFNFLTFLLLLLSILQKVWHWKMMLC